MLRDICYKLEAYEWEIKNRTISSTDRQTQWIMQTSSSAISSKWHNSWTKGKLANEKSNSTWYILLMPNLFQDSFALSMIKADPGLPDTMNERIKWFHTFLFNTYSDFADESTGSACSTPYINNFVSQYVLWRLSLYCPPLNINYTSTKLRILYSMVIPGHLTELGHSI